MLLVEYVTDVRKESFKLFDIYFEALYAYVDTEKIADNVCRALFSSDAVGIAKDALLL